MRYRWGAAVGQTNTRDDTLGFRIFSCANHSLRIFDVVRQRLLTQHVLAGCQQRLNNFTVQEVRHHNADHINVIGFSNRLPGGIKALKAETCRGGFCQFCIGISHRHQADLGQCAVIGCWRGQVPRRVCFAGHARADDSDADLL